MTIHQIIYISASTVSFDDDSLAELLEQARKSNAQKDLSGMLLYHNGSFIQVLEGPRQAVKDVYKHICRDSRHNSVQVLFEGDVEERAFDEWSMGYVPCGTLRDVPEGFHPFLVSGFRRNPDTADMARKALAAFKKGRWRAAIAA